MEIAYNVVLVVACIVAVLFSLLVFITGKGDAMSGGASGIRTTFKGKAGFDDQVFRLIVGLGLVFVVMMLVLDFMATRMSQ